MRLKGLPVVYCLIWLFFPLFLGACAATNSGMKTWEGDLPPGVEPSRLTVPADLDLLSVNGLAIRNSFLQGEVLTYQLRPGRQELVYRYQSQWMMSDTRGAGGTAPKEEVKSDPVSVTFDAEPGARYRLVFDPPADRKAAKRLARNFSGRLIGADGEVLARGREKQTPGAKAALARIASGETESQPPETARGQPAPEPQKAAPRPLAPKLVRPGWGNPRTEGRDRPSPADRLQQLKDIWAEADQQTREAFVKWVLQ